MSQPGGKIYNSVWASIGCLTVPWYWSTCKFRPNLFCLLQTFPLGQYYSKLILFYQYTLLSHFAARVAASSSAVMWCFRDDSTCWRRSCWVCISFLNEEIVTSLRLAKFSFSTASSSASRILSRSDCTRAVCRAAFCLLLSISHCSCNKKSSDQYHIFIANSTSTLNNDFSKG